MLTMNPAITYSVFERCKSGILESRKNKGKKMELSSGEVFVIGAFAKTVATIVTYPLIMAKIKLQWKPAKKDNETEEERRDREQKTYNGIIDVLKKSYQTNGIPGLYQVSIINNNNNSKYSIFNNIVIIYIKNIFIFLLW